MKAVFFDAGGTLVHIDYQRIAGLVLRVLGRDVSQPDFVAAEYAGRAAVEAGMARGDLPTDTSRWGVHFRAALGSVGVTSDEFDAMVPEILAENRRKHLWTHVLPGTGEGLAALRKAGYFVAVISNADGHVEELLESVGLRQHLEFVVDSGIEKIEKPDRRIFEIALGRAREAGEAWKTLAFSDCYYVGDTLPIDVVGSRGVGMQPVLLDPLGRYGHAGCRTIVDVPSYCRELAATRAAA
jgi:putative hydrolase of the HAD superfamily